MEEIVLILKPFIKYFELLAAIAGILSFKKWKNTTLQWLIFYLWIIVVFEFIGSYLSKLNLPIINGNLYKYFVLPFEFLFWLLFLRLNIESKKNKKVIAVFIASFLATLVIELVWFKKIYFTFSSIYYSVGSVLLLPTLFFYFQELVSSNRILSFYRQPLFYIFSGVLIFYMGSLPFYLLFNFIQEKYYDTVFLPYYFIAILFNFFMYTLFAIAFIWTKPK